MTATEDDLQKLEQERRESAAKVRLLLEQLEAAEKEFDAITQRVRSLRGASGHAFNPGVSSRSPGQYAPQPRSGGIR